MKHAISIPFLILLSLTPGKHVSFQGFPFCSKAGSLSLFKNILTYHIVALYLVNYHYVTHNVISFQTLEARGGPQGFSFTQDKPESSSWALDGLLEEAIEWLLKKY